MPPDVCLDWVGLLFTVCGILTIVLGCLVLLCCYLYQVERGAGSVVGNTNV